MSIRLSLYCPFIKLINAFDFPDPEPSIINILYEWSVIYGHFLLWSLSFVFVISSKLTIFVYYNNSVYGKRIRENDFFKLMNNSVYSKTIKEKINAKKI